MSVIFTITWNKTVYMKRMSVIFMITWNKTVFHDFGLSWQENVKSNIFYYHYLGLFLSIPCLFNCKPWSVLRIPWAVQPLPDSKTFGRTPFLCWMMLNAWSSKSKFFFTIMLLNISKSSPAQTCSNIDCWNHQKQHPQMTNPIGSQ